MLPFVVMPTLFVRPQRLNTNEQQRVLERRGALFWKLSGEKPTSFHSALPEMAETPMSSSAVYLAFAGHVSSRCSHPECRFVLKQVENRLCISLTQKIRCLISLNPCILRPYFAPHLFSRAGYLPTCFSMCAAFVP